MAPKRKYQTPQQMQSVIDSYFDQCEENRKPPTMAGLANALGFAGRQSLFDYCHRVKDQTGNGGDNVTGNSDILDGCNVGEGEGALTFADTIKKARGRVEQYLEETLVGRTQGQVAGVIFNLKNNFGWRDVTERHETTVRATVDMDNRELARRLAYLLTVGEGEVLDLEADKPAPAKIANRDKDSM